jgi:hypothetical protein
MTAPDVIDNVIDELERRGDYPAWSDSPWLAGELTIEFDGDGVARLGVFDLQYDVQNGLLVSRTSM